jgi:hypothetical protein
MKIPLNGNDQDRRVSSIVLEGKPNNPPHKTIGNADHSENRATVQEHPFVSM